MRRLVLALALANAGCGELAGIEEKEYVKGGIRALSALNCTTCAVLDKDGSVWCWGENTWGQLGDRGPSDLAPRQVRLESGEAIRAKDVSVGTSHVCAISEEGDVYCWGANAAGQSDPNNQPLSGQALTDACKDPINALEPLLGVALASSAPPTRVDLGQPATAVSAGLIHTCALVDKTVYCWGSNHAGQCGQALPDGLFQREPTNGVCGWDLFSVAKALCDQDQVGAVLRKPEAVAAAKDVDQLVVQRNTSCALTGTTVSCWGNNCSSEALDPKEDIPGYLGNDCKKGGQLGVSPASLCFSDKPIQVATNRSYLSLGHISGYAVGYAEGDVLSWGWNAGHLGHPGAEDFSPPAPVELTDEINLEKAETVARTNGWHQLAKGSNGDAFSWGENHCGELGQSGLGLGKVSSRAGRAYRIERGADHVATGQDHTCYAIDGSVYCFGRGDWIGRKGNLGEYRCGNEGVCSNEQAVLEPYEVPLN